MRNLMKPHILLKILGCLPFTLVAGILIPAMPGIDRGAWDPLIAGSAAAAETHILLEEIQSQEPVANLQQAKVAWARCEKILPGAGKARIPLLAEASRLCFILGQWGSEGKDHRKYFEKGKKYAELLLRENPGNLEGHYWLAINLAGLADVSRAREGLAMVPRIVQELQRAAAIDPLYNQAGPDRVLGRIYSLAPAWPLSVGDLQKSLDHLRTAVKLAPQDSTNHFYLAEALLQAGLIDETRQELQKVITAPSHANWAPALQEDRQDAIRLLEELQISAK